MPLCRTSRVPGLMSAPRRSKGIARTEASVPPLAPPRSVAFTRRGTPNKGIREDRAIVGTGHHNNSFAPCGEQYEIALVPEVLSSFPEAHILSGLPHCRS